MGPALAAGNVQIIKPAEQTPLTMLRFVELAQEVLPPGVLQVVTGDGVPVGDALVAPSRPSALVSLTGDTATGKLIAKNAADTRQARPPRARRQGADDRARRRGSRRPSPRRSRSAATSTRARTAPRRHASSSSSGSTTTSSPTGRRRSTALTVGDPGDGRRDRDGAGHLGGAAGARARLPRARGRRKGDGRSPAARRSATRGFFVKPTIVADVEQDAEIVQSEVFGPVVTVQRFASDDEAIAMANDVRYGLASSVFSENVGRALKVAAQLDFGMRLDQRAPLPADAGDAARRLQGVRLRKDMSMYSMEEYTRIKH